MSRKKSTNQHWRQIVTDFQHKNDRATALVGSAFLKTHLAQLIACFCVDDADQIEQLLGPERPLGSFGARVRAAYCLGLISKTEFHDLKLIFDIRNSFSDQVRSASFNDSGIRERCKLLIIPRDIFPSTFEQSPRELFIYAVALLAQQLACRAEIAESQRRQVADDYLMVDTHD